MSLTPADITIAVTVFARRTYLAQAIASALDQTLPVRVMVVEDCGPDAALGDFVRQQFGNRVEYFRNPRRRGIFGNWNACLDYCQTPWLSILHDDDYLDRGFVAAMVELSRQAPDCGLYFGHTQMVDDQNQPLSILSIPVPAEPWRRVALEDMMRITPFPFPGQLFSVAAARAQGGFRESSQYCGDWEMWAKLTAASGAAQTRATVAFNRHHTDPGRGTSRIIREGRLYPLTYVQRKRILAMLRARGGSARFDRRRELELEPYPSRHLLAYAHEMSPRLRAYNTRLLALSKSPNCAHALAKLAARLLGGNCFALLSRLRRPASH